jgi:methylthioribose-1-phosphate isomerase
MIDAIYRLAVRGAPAIGVAGAFGMRLAANAWAARAPSSAAQALPELERAARALSGARPTAVNLSWGVERMLAHARALAPRTADAAQLARALGLEAEAILDEDAARCDAMGRHGASLVPEGARLLTHCNAGALATAGAGTALAPIYEAVRQGRRVHVYVDETRPLLQGSRLTAFELQAAGIDATLITDSMAGSVMHAGKVDAVFVGADRIAENGDVCNKIGTYSVAVLAREHRLPFYVVAPSSTFDLGTPSGASIPIEERAPEEITEGFGRRTAPHGVRVYNPAFDITPARLVSAIVTERGILTQPDRERVRAHLA